MAGATARSVAPAEPASEAPQVETRSPRAVARSPDPRRSAIVSPRRPQAAALKVSSPSDAAEREADSVAKAVINMPAPTVGGIQRSPLLAARAPAPAAPRTEPRAPTQSGVDPAIDARIKAALGRGTVLSPKTRAFLEPRFRASFANVRIHIDSEAKALANRLGARAFTYGKDIFFNEGQYDPESRDGLELLAHELTHTIQQSETIQRKEAAGAYTLEAPRVEQRTERQASRLGISDALDYFADKANNIPGYRMFTILIGVNPINMSSVEASAANILRAIVEFLPGGHIIVEVLDNYGVFDKVGGWIEAQLKSLGITGSAIKAAIDEFLDSLGWRDIFHLGDVWDRAKRIFTGPIDRIITFAKSLFVKILEFVRDAVLKPLAKLAEGTRFYPLLKAVLGKDPVTGEPVEGGASEVIGGFMTMIGQEELWQNIQKANAIPRAWTWFKTAMKGLLGLVTSIPKRFIDGLKSLEIMDFVVLPRAFQKIGAVLGSFLADFGAWALTTIFDLLKIIMEVVAPGVMPYIYKAGAAFKTIIKDPIRFVKTLVAAAMQGFRQFASNFLKHLQASLVGWLTGAMAGANIYIPQGFNPKEILKFVLSILGLTWTNIRGKLVKATNETTVVLLETGFDIVVTLVTEGPAAAWQKIVDAIGNLKQMAIDAIMDFVKSKVVQAAVTKLLSMLSPAGALIQAIIAIYNTVMFFIERLKQIAQVAASFIDALATIAAGNIMPAANRVEQTMAGLLTLVISFLARIAGLGKVSDAVTNLINKIRTPIDNALDKLVEWIVAQAKKLGRAVMSGAKGAAAKLVNWFKEKRQMTFADGAKHTLSFKGNADLARLMLASVEKPVEDHLTEATKDTGLSKAARGRAQTALDFYAANLKPISGRTIPTPTPKADQDLLDALPNNLTKFADLLRAISADTDVDVPKAAKFAWGGGPGKVGVEELSNRGSRGGKDASVVDVPGWSLLQKGGLTTGGAKWVRMHLISAAYGGIDDKKNLVPAPTAINTGGVVAGFESKIRKTFYDEKSVKDVRAAKSLFASLAKREAVVWLETTTTGGYWPEKKDATGAQIYPGGTFHKGVAFKGGIHFPRDGAWVKDPTTVLTDSVGIPDPDFSKSYQPNINMIGEPQIAALTGIDPNYAREIVEERGGTPAKTPHTKTNFKSRMRAYRQSRNPPVAITPKFTDTLDTVAAAMEGKNPKLKWQD